MNQSDYRQISVSQSNIIDSITFKITDQNNRLLQLNNVNFELSFLFQIYPKYDLNTIIDSNTRSNRRRNINNVPQQINNIPTQPTRILRRQGQPLVVDELDINSTHPIENTSAIQHASNRLVLDNLLDIVENQN